MGIKFHTVKTVWRGTSRERVHRIHLHGNVKLAMPINDFYGKLQICLESRKRWQPWHRPITTKCNL